MSTQSRQRETEAAYNSGYLLALNYTGGEMPKHAIRAVAEGARIRSRKEPLRKNRAWWLGVARGARGRYL